jgi:hypothetical protein
MTPGSCSYGQTHCHLICGSNQRAAASADRFEVSHPMPHLTTAQLLHLSPQTHHPHARLTQQNKGTTEKRTVCPALMVRRWKMPGQPFSSTPYSRRTIMSRPRQSSITAHSLRPGHKAVREAASCLPNHYPVRWVPLQDTTQQLPSLHHYCIWGGLSVTSQKGRGTACWHADLAWITALTVCCVPASSC